MFEALRSYASMRVVCLDVLISRKGRKYLRLRGKQCHVNIVPWLGGDWEAYFQRANFGANVRLGFISDEQKIMDLVDAHCRLRDLPAALVEAGWIDESFLVHLRENGRACKGCGEIVESCRCY